MDAKLESVSLEASLHSTPYFIQHRTRSEHRLLHRKANRTLQQSPLVVSSQLCRRILPKIPEYGPDASFNADVECRPPHNIITPKGRKQSWNLPKSVSEEIRQPFSFKRISKLESHKKGILYEGKNRKRMHSSSRMLQLSESFQCVKLTHWDRRYDHITNTYDCGFTFNA